jgi:sec-independent protein translocase protein TatC
VSEPENKFEITNDEPPPSAREKPMGFWEHLEELRGTLIKCIVTFIIFASLIGYFMKEFNDVLLWPLHTVKAEYPKLILDLGTTSIMEGFNVAIQMCVMGGALLAAPFCLIFIGQFVAPALTNKEIKLILPVGISAIVLFLLGATFSFFLLIPSTIRVSIELNDYFGFAMRWTPGSYYSLVMWLVLGVGASFEFPLVIVILVWLGLMTTAFLRKYRRHAIVVIFIIAAVVTPTPDPINQTLFAVPLYLLYEIAIFVGSRIEKKKLGRNA